MISILLPWPPSVNRYWRHNRGRTHISTEGKHYRQEVQTRVQCNRLPTFGTTRLAVSVFAYPPDRRVRDLDNTLKALLDALAAAGVYDSDGQIDRLEIERREVRTGGEVRVTIRGLP